MTRHRLLERLDVLVRGATLPSTVDVDLRGFVELKLEAQSGRADNVRALNLQRAEASDLTRGRIRASIGPTPLSHRIVEIVAKARYYLSARGYQVSDWLIRDEIRLMRKEASVTELRPTPGADSVHGNKGKGANEWQPSRRKTRSPRRRKQRKSRRRRARSR